MCFCGDESFLKIKSLKFQVANFLKKQERERRKQQTQVRIKILEGWCRREYTYTARCFINNAWYS